MDEIFEMYIDGFPLESAYWRKSEGESFRIFEKNKNINDKK